MDAQKQRAFVWVVMLYKYHNINGTKGVRMNISHLLLTILAVSIISGCASSGTQYPKISHEDAASFEKLLLDKYVARSQKVAPEKLYVQPTNKKEKCKLPTSSDQLQRRNFKAYWDGDCKNGYAYGLGRDIAISDTHHVEEITIHDGTFDYKQKPIIFYDFVNNFVRYEFRGENMFEKTGLTEKYDIQNNNLNVLHTTEKWNGIDNQLWIHSSPLGPKKTYGNGSNGVIFEFQDATGIPAKSDDAVYVVEIKNYQSVKGGVAIARYGNGQIRHFKIGSTGQKSLVQIPKSYTDHIEAKRQEIYNAIPQINKHLEFVKRTEREYLYLACNGQHKIKGLDKKTATKICNWRNEMQPMYQAAIENSKKQLEQLLQSVEKAENERVLKQKIAQQQRTIEQQRNQQSMSEITNSLNSLSNSLRSSAAQTQQFMQPMPIYQPAPLGSSDRINCITTGPVTSCR